ncbi:MAG TPA: glycosyltransferase [Methylovirgula sp.]
MTLAFLHLSLIVALLGAAWWIAAFVFFAFTSVGTLLQPWLQGRRATNEQTPPVSAILPIKLENPGFEEAQQSIFAQRYPAYDVIFAATGADPAVIAEVQKMIAAHSAIAARVMQSSCEVAVSPKLNNLATPLGEAAHDFVLTKDSNIVFEPETLSVFMQNFTSGVGLVVGVPVAEQPKGLAGQIEAFLLNGHARLLLTASALGLGFGVGKTMLFKRGDLERAGGLESIAYTLAEDTALSRAFEKLGLKTVFAHRPLRQFIGKRSLREIYQRQLRWAVIRRAHEPLTYPLEPLSSPLPAAIAAAFAAPLVGLSAFTAFASTLAIWFAVEILIAWVKDWEVSVASLAGFVGREILALTTWLQAWTTKDVVWADTRLDVFNGAREAPNSAAPLKEQRASADKG